jgi:hypothetical protein
LQPMAVVRRGVAPYSGGISKSEVIFSFTLSDRRALADWP